MRFEEMGNCGLRKVPERVEAVVSDDRFENKMMLIHCLRDTIGCEVDAWRPESRGRFADEEERQPTTQACTRLLVRAA
jgi:hypothetical protein